VAGFNRGYFTQYLDACRGEASSPRLVDSEAYHRAWSKVGSDHQLAWIFANVDAFRARLGGLVPDTYQEILDLLGLSSIHNLAIAVNREGNGSREAMYLDAPGEKHGLLRALTPSPIDQGRFASAPANSVLYMAANYDLNAIYEEIMRVIDVATTRYVPAAPAKEFRLEMEAGLAALPIDIKKDLLEPLGSNMSMYVALPQSGGLIPDVVLSLEVRDADRLRKTFDRLSAMADNAELKSTTYQNETIHYFTIRQRDFTLQPAFAITGDQLLVASQTMVLKRALSARGQSGEKLVDTDKFKQAMSHVVGKPGEIVYFDLQQAFEFTYNSFSAVLASQIPPDAPVDGALMPSTEAIAKHLTASISAYSSDQDGILCETYSPLGLGAIVDGAMALVQWGIDQGYADILLSEAARQMHGGRRIAFEQPQPADTDPNALGRELQGRGDLEKAIAAYSRAIANGSDPGVSYFQRGYCNHSLGRYDQAIADFQQAIAHDAQVPAATYNIACGYALMGKTDVALDWLRKAFDAGMSDFELVKTDTDLDSLRSDDRFQALMKEYGITK